MNIQNMYSKFINECKGKICTDTRKIIPGSLFFAWKGENNDGNKHAEQAINLGCSYAVIDNPDYAGNDKFILVDNSMDALAYLARYHRMQFEIPVIGITGSNGKTTTKNLIESVLKTQRNVVATSGNLNNHVGVPLTLLNIKPNTEIVIVEMGANHVGEIAQLCELAMPTHGIITNIGRAHLGLFGGFNGVIKAKTELYNYLQKHEGEVFVNASDDLLRNKTQNLKRFMYGPDFLSDPICSLETLPLVSVTWRNSVIQTQLTGEYNISNIAAAISIGSYFDLQNKNIINGIENYITKNQRSEVVETSHGNMVIKDYYNANRSSIEVALENLSSINSGKIKIAILGDMFELGEYENEEHRAVIHTAIDLQIDMVILVGDAFSRCVHDYKNVYQYKTVDEAISVLQNLEIKDSLILLKASNGMDFKRIFNEVDW